MGISNSKETTSIYRHVVVAQRKNFLAKRAQNLLEGRSLVFYWVLDGMTKYIWLTKDSGEAPERGKVEYLPTPPLDEKLSKSQR